MPESAQRVKPEHIEGIIVCSENDRPKVRCLPALHARVSLAVQRVSFVARSPQVIAVGPVGLPATEDHAGGAGYLCTVCDIDDEDMPADLRREVQELDRVCTADWMVGRQVAQRENHRNKREPMIEIECFETDPFPQDMPADNRQADSPRSRSFLYRCCGFEIASFAVPPIRGRMIHTACVRGAIEYRYGRSRTGFSSTPADA